MATLKSFGIKTTSTAKQVVRFTGQFQVTGKEDGNGKKLWVGQLVQPITLYCSTNAEVLGVKGELVDELYIREQYMDENLDIWQGDPKSGMWIETPKLDALGKEVVKDGKVEMQEWVADFSTTHGVGLYQDETCKAYLSRKRKLEGGALTNPTLKAAVDALRKKAETLAPKVVKEPKPRKNGRKTV